MNTFWEYIKAHKGIVTGGCIGLITGVLIISIGFWSTLFLSVCVGIGAFFGSHNKLKLKIKEVLDRILPDIFK